MVQRDSYSLSIFIFVIIAIIGLGIADIVIYSNGHTFTGTSKSCPSLNTTTSLSLKKQVFNQWHWDYTDDTVTIQQNCPTLMHDVNGLVNDELFSRSSTSILSMYKETVIWDCHGNVLFSFRTGSVFDTIISSLHIESSFQLFDSTNTLIAYMAGTNFFIDNLQIMSVPQNQEIATLYRNTLSFSSWTWQIHVNQSHTNLWPAILSMAGYSAFSNNGNIGSSNNNKSDVCNQFFWGVAYMFLGIACVIGIIIICYIKIMCYDKRSNCCQINRQLKPTSYVINFGNTRV